jgi:hypothetical protein
MGGWHMRAWPLRFEKRLRCARWLIRYLIYVGYDLSVLRCIRYHARYQAVGATIYRPERSTGSEGPANLEFEVIADVLGWKERDGVVDYEVHIARRDTRT